MKPKKLVEISTVILLHAGNSVDYYIFKYFTIVSYTSLRLRVLILVC